MRIPGGEAVCYGHHVWRDRVGYAECIRCGLIDRDEPKGTASPECDTPI